MKKASQKTKPKSNQDDMLPEYDFTGQKGVRGKYYRAYQQGYSVCVEKADGTVEVRHYKPEEGAVVLEPDVQKYFPNSASVNKALRSLIAILPEKRPARKSVSK